MSNTERLSFEADFEASPMGTYNPRREKPSIRALSIFKTDSVFKSKKAPEDSFGFEELILN